MSGSDGPAGLDLTGGLPNVLTVVRPDDVMVLQFRFANLRLDTTTGQPQLLKQDTGFDAWVTVEFPPQATGEESLLNDGPVPEWPGFQARATLSGPTRLAFRARTPIPFTLNGLLDWNSWTLGVAPSAAPESVEVADLPTEGTVIEAPYRFGLSPNEGGTWQHSFEPVTQTGRTELWHTEHTGALRGIWVGPDGLSPEVPVDLPLTQADRQVVARLSQTVAPLVNHRLILSARGAWLDLAGDWLLPLPGPFLDRKTIADVAHGLGENQIDELWLGASTIDELVTNYVDDWVFQWPEAQQPYVLREVLDAILNGDDIDPDAGSVVVTWSLSLPALEQSRVNYRHRSTQGRDQYVKLTTPGFLYPWGHRATLLTISERQLRPPPNDVLSAFLVKRQQILVDHPIVDYTTLGAGYHSQGRENPFADVRLLTEETSVLDYVQEFALAWPQVGQRDVAWSVLAHDYDGRAVTMTMPLLFVPAANVDGTAFDEGSARTAYGARPVDLGGQELALAPGVPLDRGSAVMVTQELVVEGLAGGDIVAGALSPGSAAFLPAMTSARVRIPAVDQLLAPTGDTASSEVVLHQAYLDHGFDATANAGQLYLSLAAPSGLDFPAQRAGGLVRPNMTVEAVSTSLGPVADAANLAAGAFDPANFLPNAKILGGIQLRDLLDRVTSGLALVPLPQFTGLDAQQTWARLAQPDVAVPVPTFVTVKTVDGSGQPNGVETRYVWKPRLQTQPIASAKFLQLDPTASLRLLTVLRSTLGSSSPTLDSQGELANFGLSFADLVGVTIKSLAFTARDGSKPDFSASGVDLEFLGDLAFVNELRRFIPSDGFSDPPAITVTPGGIAAGYSLGLPAVGVGVFSLENVRLSAELLLPFVDNPTTLTFALSSRDDPCLVTVSLFAGGAYLSLTVSTDGPIRLEAAIEFGGNFSLDLGVASGGVHVLAGIYFSLQGSAASLGGYLRAGGAVTVLGIVTISVEFYLILGFTKAANGTKTVWGEATLTVGVEVLFLRQDVSLHVRREFAGSAGDPTFEDLIGPDDWAEYCAAFGR